MSKVKVHKVKFTAEEMAYDAPAEVDFSKGQVLRGEAAWQKYLSAKRGYAKLAPEVRKAFPDDKSVNEALRSLMRQRPGRHRKSA
jgi:hypothetical protein